MNQKKEYWMRWIISGLTASVLVCVLLVADAMLHSYFTAEFAKRGLPYPPEGFDTELPAGLVRAVVVHGSIQRFRIPLVLVLVGIPLFIATVWPKKSSP
jgi:hypothetical protein